MPSIQTRLRNHIQEVKIRFNYIFLSLLFLFALSYLNRVHLTHIFLLSFSATNGVERIFIFTDVQEAFLSLLSICFLVSVAFLFPLIEYQIVCFLLPSWYKYERRKQCANFAALLFLWGIYIVSLHGFIIPQLCQMFLNFQIFTPCLKIALQAKIFSYVSWTFRLFVFALLVFTGVLLGVVFFRDNKRTLTRWKKHRKRYAWGVLVLVSLLSPPDPVSQLLLTFLIYTLWEILVWTFFIRLRSLES